MTDLDFAAIFVCWFFINFMMMPVHLFNMDKSSRIQFLWAERFKEISWYGKIIIILFNIIFLPAILFNITVTIIIDLLKGKQ